MLDFPLGADVSDRFTGTVHRNDLIGADDVYRVPQTNVITFEPGSYSGWHVHGAMTVIGVAGEGIYQEWGKASMVECVTVEVNGSMTVVFRDGTERRL